MITIKPEFKHIGAMIMDGIAGETLSKVHPSLRQLYMIDLHLAFTRFFPHCRAVHPDEAEGYTDINELDEYMVIVAGLTWTIEKIPPCHKETIEKSRQIIRKIYNHCNECNNDCEKCK